MTLTICKDIKLLPISRDYLHDIHNSFSNAIIEFLPIETLSGKIEDTLAFIDTSIKQRLKGTDLVWVVLYQQQFAGCCGIHDIASGSPHFGIWIKKELQGNGIGKKVVEFMLPWALSNLDINYIKYPVDRRNSRSLSLIKNLDLQLAKEYQTGSTKVLKVREYRLYRTQPG